MPLTALITRPQEDARPLADALAERGVAAVVEPLLTIRVLPEAAAGLAQDLAGVQALLFTSANGARAFAELSARRDIGVLAVGDATAASARALGFGAVESAGGDVEALAKLVKARLKPGAGPLFHAAGSAVAGDLARLLAADGFELRRRMLYESLAATRLSADTLLALERGRIDLVLLFSPRTAQTFADLAKAARLDLSGATALCLSDPVAASVRPLAWRRVETAARPDLPALLELVDRALAEAKPLADAAKPIDAPRPTGASPIPAFAPATPIPTVAPARGGGRGAILAGLIGAVLAAAAVAAIFLFAAPRPPTPSAGAPAADLAPRLDDLDSRLAALKKQLDGLPPPAAPDLGDLPARLDALQKQVAALKAAPAGALALPPEVQALPQRLDDLAAKLAALDQRVTRLEQKPGSDEAVAQLKSALDGLDQHLKSDEAALGDLVSMKQAIAKLQAQPPPAAGAALVLALTELRQRLAAGRPFGAEVDALARLAGRDPALSSALAGPLAALEPLAAAGAPGLARLQGEFPPVADAIARSESGAAALPPGAGFGERVLARLESLVTIRPVADGGESAAGDAPLARLARAEAALNRGDLAASVAELSAISGPGAAAAGPWLERARARLAADAAASALADAILARLSEAAP